MGIYDQDFNKIYKQLLPPDKRNNVFIAWGNPVMKPLQWLHDLIYNDYANGTEALRYDSTTAYSKYDRVIFNNAVYECLADNTGISPLDSNYWVLVTEDFRGVRERVRYNGQKLTLEWILYKWFGPWYKGPELTADPTFTTGGTWYEGGPSPISVTSGSVDVSTLAGDNINTGPVLVVGKTYSITIKVTSIVAASGSLVSGESIGTITTVGTHVFTYTKVASFQRLVLIGAGTSFVISEFSVKEVLYKPFIQPKHANPTNRNIYYIDTLDTDDNSFLVGETSPETSFVPENSSLQEDYVGEGYTPTTGNFRVRFPLGEMPADLNSTKGIQLKALVERYKLYGTDVIYEGY